MYWIIVGIAVAGVLIWLLYDDLTADVEADERERARLNK